MAIDRDKYRSKVGESKPKLTADMIAGGKTVLTIMDLIETDVKGMEPSWAITFAEFPEHTYWTNKTQQDAFLDAVDAGLLPDDLKSWVGQRIPFYKKQNTNPTNDQKVWKLYPVPVELWEISLSQFDEAKKRAQSTPVPTTAGARKR